MVKDWFLRRKNLPSTGAYALATPAVLARRACEIARKTGDSPLARALQPKLASESGEDPRTGETLVENAFLIGLSQQVATHRSMDVIANNIANLSTPAFKREALQFEQYVVELPANEAEPTDTVDVSFVIDR